MREKVRERYAEEARSVKEKEDGGGLLRFVKLWSRFGGPEGGPHGRELLC